MPEISRFYGIIIRMFFAEHDPPHFHAKYDEYNAQISIESGKILNGSLPARAEKLIYNWVEEHRVELFENWALCKSNKQPRKIEPLR